MLSVCIPVFNFDVQTLVRSIIEQARAENIEFEVLVYDDGSEETYKIKNRSIAGFEHVVYRELEINLGRSKIRNLLAQHTKFEYLLFMDCDAELLPYFIKNYLNAIQTNQVLVGGVAYAAQKPEKNFQFRWKYGITRENPPAEIRNQNPYNSFKTFNFLIPKSVFNKVQFNENLLGYGHEDTLFGIELKKNKIPIVHIENPLIHLGIEPNDIFLRKTETGIQNLLVLLNSANTPKEFSECVSILKFRNKLPSWSLRIIAFLYKISKPALAAWFKSGYYQKYLFDFYKLGYLCSSNK